jgi:hypothetical protein
VKQREFKAVETTGGSKIVEDPSLKKVASKAKDTLMNVRTGEYHWSKPEGSK